MLPLEDARVGVARPATPSLSTQGILKTKTSKRPLIRMDLSGIKEGKSGKKKDFFG